MDGEIKKISPNRKPSKYLRDSKFPKDPKALREAPDFLPPAQSFMDWLEKRCPEVNDPGRMSDRELLVANARRALYLEILREKERYME